MVRAGVEGLDKVTTLLQTHISIHPQMREAELIAEFLNDIENLFGLTENQNFSSWVLLVPLLQKLHQDLKLP